MKTYLITESNEPLREGCLTQCGAIRRYTNKWKYGCRMINGSYNLTEAKHLKCYELTDPLYLNGNKAIVNYRKTEITDPEQLQKIWEAIRGEEPKQLLRCNKCIGMNSDCSTCYGSSEVVNTNYYGNLNKWQNFTLKEGTYQVDGNDTNVVSIQAKVLPDNNGWISIKVEWQDHHTVVLKNKRGDTFTFNPLKYENLADFLH